jgi:60S ribosome subunit biogenesis protein NIP7
MRPLEESELEQVLTKLFSFVGKNIENVLQRTDSPHSLRLHKKRVYYVRDDVMKRATSVGRDQLVSLGMCIGKFTHSDKFRLTIGALDLLAAHAKYKVRMRCDEFVIGLTFSSFIFNLVSINQSMELRRRAR